MVDGVVLDRVVRMDLRSVMRHVMARHRRTSVLVMVDGVVLDRVVRMPLRSVMCNHVRVG